MKENFIEKLTEDFAVRIINLYKFLQSEKKEYVLSKQLLRCGTSIGANVNEAEGGISTNDFIAKLQISLKEARETKYWLRLLYRTDYLDDKEYKSIYNDACLVEATLVKILKSKKENKEKLEKEEKDKKQSSTNDKEK